MSACEQCWLDAYVRKLSDPSKSQTEHYHDLLSERPAPCGDAPPEPSRWIIERDADGLPKRLIYNPITTKGD
jgi:hypothetical protein